MWGVESGDDMEIIGGWGADCFVTFGHGVGETVREAVQLPWNSLHTEPGKTWDGSPEIAALAFLIERRNTDSNKLPG
jgi:hypothetical protein